MMTPTQQTTAPTSSGWSGQLNGVLDMFNDTMNSLGDFKINLAKSKAIRKQSLNDYYQDHNAAAKTTGVNPSPQPAQGTMSSANKPDYTKPVLYGVGALVAVAALVAIFKK